MTRLAIALVLVAMMIPATPVRAIYCEADDDLCNQINDTKQNQVDIQHQLDDIQKKIKETQAKIAALDVLIARINQQVEAQRAAIAATQAQIDETERQIRFTQAEISRREAHIKVREQLLDQRVRAMDKHGTVNYFELILTSRSFNQLIDRVVIMQDIIRSDRNLIEALKQERDQLARLREDLDRRDADLQTLQRKQVDQKAQLEASLKVQQDARAYQATLQGDYERQSRELAAEQAKIEDQLKVLQQQYDDRARAVGGGTGRFGWPIGSHNITQGFGCSTLLGEPYWPSCPTKHMHTGIDLAGPYGSPIFAADAGIVSLTQPAPGGGYGNYVIITHGNGYSSLYAHMDHYVVRKDQVVARGQVIGAEGSTGYSTGPHLHFEIRFNSTAQNPCPFIGC